MPKKKPKSKKISKKRRGEIKKAAEAIPSLIVDAVADAPELPIRPKGRPKKVSAPSATTRKNLRKKKRMLWTGVTIIMVCILGLWYINMRTLLYDVRIADSTNDLLDTIREDYNTIVKQNIAAGPQGEEPEDVEPEVDVDSVKATLGSQLSALFTKTVATSTPATSTEEVITIFEE